LRIGSLAAVLAPPFRPDIAAADKWNQIMRAEPFLFHVLFDRFQSDQAGQAHNVLPPFDLLERAL
jgi:hypothetical protein